jgi:hypothetical protein
MSAEEEEASVPFSVRIIQINDVYELDNFPRLVSAIQRYAQPEVLMYSWLGCWAGWPESLWVWP